MPCDYAMTQFLVVKENLCMTVNALCTNGTYSTVEFIKFIFMFILWGLLK